MTPKEILDDITNTELYDGVIEKDAFMFHAEGGYPHILEDMAVKAMEIYAKKVSEPYITALTAIANIPDEQVAIDGRLSRAAARKILNLE